MVSEKKAANLAIQKMILDFLTEKHDYYSPKDIARHIKLPVSKCCGNINALSQSKMIEKHPLNHKAKFRACVKIDEQHD